MTARTTYEVTVKATGPAQAATQVANLATAQETVNATGINAGAGRPVQGSNASFVTATIAMGLAACSSSPSHAAKAATTASSSTSPDKTFTLQSPISYTPNGTGSVRRHSR